MNVRTLLKNLHQMVQTDSRINDYEVQVGIDPEYRTAHKDKWFFTVTSEDFDHDNETFVLRIPEEVVPYSFLETYAKLSKEEE